VRQLFRNPEMRSITYKFILLQGIILLFLMVFINIEVKQLNKAYVNENIAVAGKILKANPNLEKDVVGYFTKGADKEDVQVGEKVLSKYGYTKDLNIYQNETIVRFYNNIQIKFAIAIVLSTALLFIVIVKEYRNIFNKIRNICSAAEKIINRNFDIELQELGEGEFCILAHQFNEMSKILKHSIEGLKREKVFLKNIISDISHQLKTPLSSVIMFNEIMVNDLIIEEEDRKKLVVQSHEQLNRMEWLILNMLKLARLEAGAIEFDVRENCLGNTIDKSLAPLLIKAENKKQCIKIDGNKAAVLRHDVDWTAEAISNIVKNAIEHTDIHGQIQVKIDETPLCIQIKIMDNGEGIKREDIPRIFERFYKGSNDVNPNSIGIGLSLCKAIIEGQGGSITVDSEEGKGTEIVITFLKHVI